MSTSISLSLNKNPYDDRESFSPEPHSNDFLAKHEFVYSFVILIVQSNDKPAPEDNTLEDQKSIQTIDCERVPYQQHPSRKHPNDLVHLKANGSKDADQQPSDTFKTLLAICGSLLSTTTFHEKDGNTSNLIIFKPRIQQSDEGSGQPSIWTTRVALETGSSTHQDTSKDLDVNQKVWIFDRVSLCYLNWIFYKDNGTGSTRSQPRNPEVTQEPSGATTSKLKHKATHDPPQPSLPGKTPKRYPPKGTENSGIWHYTSESTHHLESHRPKDATTSADNLTVPKKHAQEIELVSELSTYALGVQMVVSKVSKHIHPEKENSSICYLNISQRSHHSTQQRNQEQPIQNDNKINTNLDSRTLPRPGPKSVNDQDLSQSTTRIHVRQRPGYAQDTDRISLLRSFFAFPTPIVRPNSPHHRIGNRNVIRRHHGHGYLSNLAHKDNSGTRPTIKSVDTFTSTDQRTQDVMENTALSHPERPDEVRKQIRINLQEASTSNPYKAETRLARTIMQSKTHDAQQWPRQLGKASPQGPPAMQEKMLTKSQTSTPTSQPGTTKPHGLINTSKPVRTDPQRYSPNDISTIHNYQLKLKSLDGRDPEGRPSTFFTKKVDPLPPECRGPSSAGTTTFYTCL